MSEIVLRRVVIFVIESLKANESEIFLNFNPLLVDTRSLNESEPDKVLNLVVIFVIESVNVNVLAIVTTLFFNLDVVLTNESVSELVLFLLLNLVSLSDRVKVSLKSCNNNLSLV